MEKNKKKSGIKVLIVVLSILLVLSLLALICLLLCRCAGDRGPTSVIIPDNLIDPTGGTGGSEPSAPSEPSGTTGPADPTDGTQDTATEPTQAPTTQATETTKDIYAGLGLYINANQYTDNTPFSVPNMFPGDAEERYYAVQVCYREKVTVYFQATVRPDYRRLAEVMMVKVELLNTGEVLYDGLMRDMPELSHELKTTEEVAAEELFYRITAYLDTSVGNEYQNRTLIADFDWWVDETENLEPPASTGDNTPLTMVAAVAGVCLVMIGVLLVLARRKEDADDEEE